MLLNQFSVRVSEGAEQQNGYVELSHGQEYTLFLRNMNALPCDAEVEIDGKGIGTFRIRAHSSMALERPQNDEARFTFVVPGSQEAIDGKLDVNNPSLGLISVTFTPGNEKPKAKPLVNVRPRTKDGSFTGQYGAGNFPEGDVAYASAGMPQGMLSPDATPRGAGGTVLTGHSDQQFYTVEPLDYDYTRRTTIHLRLVSRGTVGASTAHPLVSSTPIPPRIG